LGERGPFSRKKGFTCGERRDLKGGENFSSFKMGKRLQLFPSKRRKGFSRPNRGGRLLRRGEWAEATLSLQLNQGGGKKKQGVQEGRGSGGDDVLSPQFVKGGKFYRHLPTLDRRESTRTESLFSNLSIRGGWLSIYERRGKLSKRGDVFDASL